MDPFFSYFKQERQTISRHLYGPETPRFKEYPHAPTVALPPAETLATSLGDTLLSRRSTRDEFATKQPITCLQLSTILYWSIGAFSHDGTYRRPHPSGGAKYPIEAYVLARNVTGVPAGVYHYQVRNHCLEELAQRSVGPDIRQVFYYPFTEDAAAALCLTFIKSRSIQRYGALAYKLGMLEAGHVGQNLYLVAQSLGIGICALGSGDTEGIHGLLGIDGGNEHFVYGLVVGNVQQKRKRAR